MLSIKKKKKKFKFFFFVNCVLRGRLTANFIFSKIEHHRTSSLMLKNIFDGPNISKNTVEYFSYYVILDFYLFRIKATCPSG